MERNEMEREMILEERREKLQKYQDRQILKQMVADQEGHAVDSDSDSRPTTRRRAPVSKRAKQLEELKQKRKSKSEREEKRAKKKAAGSDYDSEEENRERRSPSVPVYTDSEDGDGEYTKEEKPSTKKKGKSREPAGKDDLTKICIPRAKLAQYWPCPWFSDYVEGAYVRMGVGQENGEPIYRLAKIEKVADAKSSKLYKLEKNVTDVKLTLIIGDDKKDMTMEMVSNSPPSDVSFRDSWDTVMECAKSLLLYQREFNRYIAILTHKNVDIPLKSDIEAKLESLQKYKDAVLTEVCLAWQKNMACSFQT
jgi:RNA polymerase-associated protein RTF1